VGNGDALRRRSRRWARIVAGHRQSSRSFGSRVPIAAGRRAAPGAALETRSGAAGVIVATGRAPPGAPGGAPSPRPGAISGGPARAEPAQGGRQRPRRAPGVWGSAAASGPEGQAGRSRQAQSEQREPSTAVGGRGRPSARAIPLAASAPASRGQPDRPEPQREAVAEQPAEGHRRRERRYAVAAPPASPERAVQVDGAPSPRGALGQEAGEATPPPIASSAFCGRASGRGAGPDGPGTSSGRATASISQTPERRPAPGGRGASTRPWRPARCRRRRPARRR